jgi:hypothetical protein
MSWLTAHGTSVRVVSCPWSCGVTLVRARRPNAVGNHRRCAIDSIAHVIPSPVPCPSDRVRPMAYPREPPGRDVLRLFYYIVGEDQALARAEVRRQTADRVAQSKETMTQSRALLERLKIAERAGWPMMDDGPENC